MNDSRDFRLSILLSFPVFYLFWILFVGTFAFHELLIGIAASLLATLGLFIINACYPAKFSPTLRELLSLWRIPWYLVSGTWEIVEAAGKDLLGVKRAKSEFQVVPFRAGKKDDGHDTARRVLAVVYSTITPTSIVLGINTGERKLLLHQIERGSVSQMAKDLGAQA
jgi:multisubunit Na+/H+ antiporter MnhE subunit